MTLDVVLDTLAREQDKNARLSEQIERMADQVIRIQRASMGIPEQPRKAKPVEQMPAEIRQQIMSVGDGRIRAMQIKEAWRQYEEAGSWEDVLNRNYDVVLDEMEEYDEQEA